MKYYKCDHRSSAKTMLCCGELKLLYATIILLLEAELLVNTGAMESKRSSILVSQNADDLKSLELCTTRNQQRLGSVFGNFTRHHKKGIILIALFYNFHNTIYFHAVLPTLFGIYCLYLPQWMHYPTLEKCFKIWLEALEIIALKQTN